MTIHLPALDSVLPWTALLDEEQRGEFMDDVTLAVTDPDPDVREGLLADVLARYEQDAHDQADRNEQHQLHREAVKA